MQVQELSGEANWLLDQLHILPGASAIDLGCGTQGVLDLLADRVGPQGNVVGLERSEGFVASARAFVADRNFANVKVVQGDAKATNLPRGSFDVVHARLVLVNVPQPRLVVEEMVALAKPGGVVVSHEADYLPHCCDPPSPAWDRLFGFWRHFPEAKGIDLFVGRKTHRLLRDAGIVDVLVRPVIHIYPHGHNRPAAFFLISFRASATRRSRKGSAEEGELDVLMAELRQHLDDRERAGDFSHLFFQGLGPQAVTLPGGEISGL